MSTLETHDIVLYHDELAAILARKNLLPGVAGLRAALLVTRDGAERDVSAAPPAIVAVVLWLPPAAGGACVRMLGRGTMRD